MKFNQLKFQTIGPFKDLHLTFPVDKSLHIVYGRNESGKSTALKYIFYFLFGIPRKELENYNHISKKHMIEAIIIDCNNTETKFRRFKKDKLNLLLSDDTDGRVLLEGLLNNLTEEEFNNFFGISHKTLQAGANLLLQGKGDFAKAIFEAGSGYSNLNKILSGFNARCEQLYKIGGQNQKIAQIINEIENQKITIDSQKVNMDQCHDIAGTIEAKKANLQEQKKIRDELFKRQTIIKSNLQIHPLVIQLRNDKEILTNLQEIPFIKEKEISTLENLLSHFSEQLDNKQDFENKANALKSELDQLKINEGILTNEDQILQLTHKMTFVTTHLEDIEKRKAERKREEELAKNLTRDLYEHQDLEQISKLVPNLALRSTIEELGVGIQSNLASIQTLKEQVSQNANSIKGKALELDNLNLSAQYQEIKLIAYTISSTGLEPKTLTQGILSLNKKIDLLSARLRGIEIWPGTLETLASTTLPTTIKVKQFAINLEELENNFKELKSDIRNLTKEVANHEKEMKKASLDTNLPSRQNLLDLRKQRASLWDSVLMKQTKEKQAVPPESEFFKTYQKIEVKIDNLTDLLLDNADKVALTNLLHDQIKSVNDILAKKQTEYLNIETSINNLLYEWKALWATVGVSEPSKPNEMIHWLEKVKGIVDDWNGISTEIVEMKKSEVNQTKLFQEASKLLQIDLTCVDLAWTKIIKFLEEELSKQELKNILSTQTDSLKASSIELTTTIETKRQALELDQIKFEKLVEKIQIPGTSDFQIVKQYLDKITAIKGHLDSMVIASHRIESMQIDIQNVKSSLEQVYSAIGEKAGAMENSTITEKIRALSSRLKSESDLKNNWNQLIKDQKNISEKIKTINDSLCSLKVKLNPLAIQINLLDVLELSNYFPKLREKSKVSQSAESTKKNLLDAGFDPSEENNLSELLNLDKTALETEHQKNENRLQEFEQEISVLNQELGRLDQSLNDLKQDTGNYSSRAVLSTTLIECKSLVHDFIQHALAKIVLKETIRNFNEKFANPILTRAQAHFQCLTDNSFAGIMTDQESKSFYLSRRHADATEDEGLSFGLKQFENQEGNTVLSDGTADQLFLSLRLAAIELYLDQYIAVSKETMPIILDDILVNFDDNRTIATLDCLAKLSEKSQVILFTHHQHLEELAKKCKNHDKIFFQRMPDQVIA